jgi:LexA-binding, inner membrane-associated putative hydrolase
VREEKRTFAVGHFSVGYILAKGSSKATKTRINLPTVFMLSVIPDIDLLLPFLQHRGPLHSIILLTAIFVPFFAKYKSAAVPYYLSLLQHPLIGDFFTGGNVQLFWPITRNPYGFGVSITSPLNIGVELLSFLLALLILIRTRDVQKLIRSGVSSLILTIPFSTVLFPSLLGFPLEVPLALLVPHITYALLFLAAITLFLLQLSHRLVMRHSS